MSAGADLLPISLARRLCGRGFDDRAQGSVARPWASANTAPKTEGLDESPSPVQGASMSAGPDPADVNTAGGDVLDQPLVREDPKRLPDGVARDRQGLGQLLLPQPGPRKQAAGRDLVAEHRRRLLRRARPWWQGR